MLADAQGALEDRLRCGEIAGLIEENPQLLQASGHVGVVRPVELLADGEPTFDAARRAAA